MKAVRVTQPEATLRPAQAAGPEFFLSSKTIGQFREGLTIGNVLGGRVIDLLGEDKSIVQFRGFNLVSQSDLPFAKGDLIRAQVVGIGEQITMRIVQPGGNLDQASALLEQHGIPVTRESLRTVALLLRAGVPPTAMNLPQVFAGLGGVPGGPQAAGLVVLARSLGVPTSDASLDAVRVLTQAQTPLGERLGEMSSQIARLLENMQVDDGRTLRALGRVVSTLPLLSDGQSTPQQLRWFLHYVGVRYEASLMNNSPPDGSLKGLLLGARTELLQQLLLAGQRGGSTTLLQALRANLEGTLRQLDAAQILARIPSLNLPHLYLHIPFWGSLPGPPLTLEVRGRKRSPTEEMDEDNTDIEFSVKSRRWGLVHLRFAMRSGRTRGTIEAESPEARMFIEKKVGRLMESLRDIGYGVDQLSVLVARSVELGRPVLQVAGLGGYHLDMEV